MDSELTAFVAGYIEPSLCAYEELVRLLSKLSPGIQKVTIPRNLWNGYGFLQFKSKKALGNFLKLKQVFIKGFKLTITKHKEGRYLDKFKRAFNNRRIFVRVLAQRRVEVDLHELFGQSGEVEEAYFIPESELIQPSNYTIIGYVLFKKECVAKDLIRLGFIQLDSSSKILIKQIEDRHQSDSARPSQPAQNREDHEPSRPREIINPQPIKQKFPQIVATSPS